MNLKISPNVLFISLSQFGMTFSFNFVMVFVPFYVHRISHYSPRETLLWVGLIMGSTSFVAAAVSTFWGSLASRFSPKKLYMRGLLSHAVLIFIMGFVTELPMLLAIRILQGVLGGISTVGLIIVSSSSSPRSATKDMGFFQNSMTLGQLIGPPAGAVSASLLGYRGAFISASALVFVTLIFCLLYVVEVPGKRRAGQRDASEKPTLNKKTLIGWGLCFTTTVQLMFLPGILPNVFETFGVERSLALAWSGLVVMSYTATSLIGTYLLCKLAPRIGIGKVIVRIGLLGVLFQALLSMCPNLSSFVVVRMAQMAFVAAILPLAISLFAADFNGKVLGFLNSGRFAGNALGPIIGTSILAFSNLGSVYLFISGLSIFILTSFALSVGREKEELPSASGEME